MSFKEFNISTPIPLTRLKTSQLLCRNLCEEWNKKPDVRYVIPNWPVDDYWKVYNMDRPNGMDIDFINYVKSLIDLSDVYI